MPTLDWLGKSAAKELFSKIPYRLIHCDADASIGSVGDGNLLIEGDNVEALKAIRPYYKGKVKCVFIDPPYNTGNENWVYNDNVSSPEVKSWNEKVVGDKEEDLTRHDKWLCMMHPRLLLLHDLLREDGVIFISIDDNEIAHLRLLMDEVFGTNNFIATGIWQKKYATPADNQGIAAMHDYIVVYRKSEKFQRNLLPRTTKQDKAYKNPDNDPRGPWKPTDYTCNKTRSERENLYYAVQQPVTGEEIWPKETRVWAFGSDAHSQHVIEKRLWWGKEGQNKVPALKSFLSEVQEGIVPNTWWTHEEAGHTDEAKKELIQILGNLPGYLTPKPTRLIKHILRIAVGPNDLVLDSFAGSGTTGQAVLELNKEDGGSRHFILIELEEDIARDITAERLRKVIHGSDNISGLGGGFRYCRLGKSLIDENGPIRKGVRFGDLAHHIYFTETGQPLPYHPQDDSPLIGKYNGVAYFLLWKGHDEPVILDAATLRTLTPHDGPRVVYADGCPLSPMRLNAANIIFKQIPYEVQIA